MAYKAYNTWNNMVSRKQRSLNEQRRYLEAWNKRLEEARKEEAEGKKTYGMGSKYWEKEIKSTSKKIEKLEAEMKTIMENIPEDVKQEINEREEIFRTFAEFISFVEKTWNERDERLKKECDEWLVEEIKVLRKSWYEIEKKTEAEIRNLEVGMTFKTGWERREFERKIMDEAEMKNYYHPRYELLKKAGFHELSEYERVSSKTIEELKEENLEDAKQSVLNLVSRVEDRVGKVTDWKNLHFGINGMLNGRVTGTCGSTYVETISAGGYNIQRFHYRVLLKK